jgi:plasmid stabilization system protein ParE
MVKVIIWTQTAQRVFDGIIDYSITHADSSEPAKKFFLEVYHQIDKISNHPTRGHRVKGTKSMRFLNFSKHYEIHYRMSGHTLYISNFFDTRQHPDKRPYS